VERTRLIQLLEQVARGETDVSTAAQSLQALPFSALSTARVDTHRPLRRGFPETIYGPGKTPEQLVEIARALLAAGQPALVTRIDGGGLEALTREFGSIEVDVVARCALVRPMGYLAPDPTGQVLIVTAGTADLPVAQEARFVAQALGNRVRLEVDCGVAGVHRLLSIADQLREARVVIAVAGMEGALASVVAGLVSCPVIAVPTSVGYGASFGGLAALLSMMSSCAEGVTVVNIDNGFGAAVAATLINRPQR
jgi:pyridinium-3,5-biscarboxylic acid mononucleotide synthase